MKKLVFITDSGFWSHSTDILSSLNKKYNLLVIVTFIEGFLNHNKDDIYSYCKLNNISVIIVDKGNFRFRNPINIITSYQKYIKTIKNYNADYIYIESFGNPYLAIMYYIFFNTKKIIIGVHDFKLHPLGDKKTKLSARIYKYLYTRLYHNFHFFSESQKNLFIKKYPFKKAFVARLFKLDIKYKEKNVDKNLAAKTFLYFGRILHYKGVDILIKAANILRDKGIDFKLIIAGSCDAFESYKNLLKENVNIETRIYRIPKEELNELFISSGFFVAPYREVTQSGPLIISYNYQTIPIASNLNGFKEYIINNKTGFLFKNESPESLATCMEKALLLNNNDKNKIYKNIKIFTKKEFDIDIVSQKYQNFFNEIS